MTTPVVIPLRTRLAVFTRLLAIQGSWNYETLVGNGIAFAMEPALRLLPEGRDGQAYRDALARESRYFNAHPYLAAIAVGALARAELDGAPAAQIERFRTALPGPLGAVGDRLVWAGWLPASSFLALLVFGLGASPRATVLVFLVLYNVGHVALRGWGLWVGWSSGMRVAPALGTPILRQGPPYIARAVALLGGMAIPLAVARLLRPGRERLLQLSRTSSGVGISASTNIDLVIPLALVAAIVVAVVLVRLHGRVAGWRVALGALAALAIYSVVA
ncbi:MAG: PTS system mannose/fructose/sorbose family transporter subunit IID [Gemmatimonadota bacterium]|nr:PTS system mannose/fructose/sorbose family transporter subunit IID [Gemmatimonadota bacterium]